MLSDDGSPSALSPLASPPDSKRQTLPQHRRNASLSLGQHIRLACQACQRKKIKCDRTFPCGQCSRSSLQCVPSQRKPRARHAGKRTVDSELRSRISKLESLVESLSGEVALGQDLTDVLHLDDASSTSQPEQKPALSTASPAALSEQSSSGSNKNVRRYIGSSFWESLTDEVQALRDVLEDDDPAEDEREDGVGHGPAEMADGLEYDYDLLICPPARIFVMPGAMQDPSPQIQASLVELYCDAVAPLYRLFHLPTLLRFLQHGLPYMGYDPKSAPARAVKCVIWYAAVTAGTEEQCQQRHGQPRSEVLQQFQRLADVAFSQANLMTTTDVPTLQAAVMYMISTRVNDSSRRVWTVTSAVVRIAQAMGLNAENPSHTPYQKEIRRRLWHQIRFLDIMCAHDRSSEPLLFIEQEHMPPPSNVNDLDFDESSAEIIPRENVITDLSFALLTFDATVVTQRLNRPENKPGGDTWQRRLDLAKDFGNLVRTKYGRWCDLDVPFHRLIATIGRTIAASMILRAVRPMNRHVSSVPPRVDSPWVLEIATDCLRYNQIVRNDAELRRFTWIIWVQWHALAVALAGLCSIRDTEPANKAWPYVQDAFEQLGKQVADSKNGMLWRPIEKLYRKATAFRDGRAAFQTPPQQHGSLPGKNSTSSSDDLFSYRAPQNHSEASRPDFSSPPSLRAPTWPSTYTGLSVAPTSQPFTRALSGSEQSPNSTFDPNLVGAMDYNTLPLASVAQPTSNLTHASLAPMQMGTAGDMSWLDWERMMQDMPDLELVSDMIMNAPHPNSSNALYPSNLSPMAANANATAINSVGGSEGTGNDPGSARRNGTGADSELDGDGMASDSMMMGMGLGFGAGTVGSGVYAGDPMATPEGGFGLF